jgi:hypothetical protein
LVGVISQPPSIRIERLPALPKERPRSNIERPKAAERVAGLLFAHAALQAFMKKSSVPKLPDFNASAKSAAQRETGRDAGIDLRPDLQRLDAEPCTTAPEVSPPATTSLRTPASTRPCAICASAILDHVPARRGRCLPGRSHFLRRAAGMDQHRRAVELAWPSPAPSATVCSKFSASFTGSNAKADAARACAAT